MRIASVQILFLSLVSSLCATEPQIRVPEPPPLPTPMPPSPQPVPGAPLLLGDMRPNSSFENAIDGAFCNSVFPSKTGPRCFARGILTTNLPDLIRGQSRLGMFFAHHFGAVSSFISVISYAGIPTQVAESVVRFVSIVVASFHSFGAWPSERLQNEPVDITCHSTAIPLQTDRNVPLGIRVSLQSSPFAADCRTSATALPFSSQAGDSFRPNRTIVPHSVTGETGDVSISNRRMGFSHDATSCKRGWLWSGLAGVSAPVQPAFILADQPVIVLPVPPVVDPPAPSPTPPNSIQLIGGQVYDIKTTAPVILRYHPAGLVSVTKKDIAAGKEYERETNFWDGSKSKTYIGPCTVYFLKAAKLDAPPATFDLDIIPIGLTEEKQIVGLTVTVNAQNPKPPPVDPVNPVDPVGPVKSFRVFLIFESGATYPAAVNSVLYGKQVEDYLNATCTGGKAGWRRRDQNLGGENDPTMAALWKAVQPKVTVTPCVAVEVNGKVDIINLDATPAAMVATLKRYSGGK